MSRKRIAVITARADATEQKEVLCGIGEAAFAANCDVVVYSNIYNHWIDDEQLNFENAIYDLFEPDYFDGAIITAESFRDLSTLDGVIEKLKITKLPTVVIEGNLDGFLSVFSDDESDMEEIADHLISEHGFMDIAILTGFEDNPKSHIRVSGCKKAFEKHGIPFDESKVYYGNFWNDSGYELAQRYINNELPFPQAVICTNDLMAHGLCDALTWAGISIPERLTVTSYDYTGGRIYHHPILTSYRRNRRKMGIDAVNLLTHQKCCTEDTDRFIKGNSCSCGADSNQLSEEINSERVRQHYSIISSVAQFSSRLTLCRTLAEYTEVLNEFFYLLHGAKELYLCLDTAWNSAKFDGEDFLCCKMNGEQSNAVPEKFSKTDVISALSGNRESPHMFYLSPISFQTRLFGYSVMCYDYPTSYDFSFRDWNKSVADTLEFLRMKNDIHYLTGCQRVSSLYDSLTGFYNLREFKQIVDEIEESCFIQAVKLSFTDGGEYLYGENFRNDIISTVARKIKQAGIKHEVRCRAYDDVFLILCKSENELFANKLKVMLHNATVGNYDERQVLISYAVYEGKPNEQAIGMLCADVKRQAEIDAAELSRRKEFNHYNALLDIRNSIATYPNKAPTLSEASRSLCVSEGYFRTVYKKCFGVSYNQDCIDAKIMRACYLLITTSMSVYAVAVKCGYADEKYFARQFRQSVGCSPAQYRSKLS